jgi:hypothetical protein
MRKLTLGIIVSTNAKSKNEASSSRDLKTIQ